MPTTLTPLRYPGGKSQLSPFVRKILVANNLIGGCYAEPFAGGAGIAMHLLLTDCVHKIFINDVDRLVYSFWKTVLDDTAGLCSRIQNCEVTIDEWYRQQAVVSDASASTSDLGFATLFLNRTNHSGILTARPIGGLSQSGKYLIDCRFNKEDLIKKISRIGSRRGRVCLTSLDALQFLDFIEDRSNPFTFLNIDPPYVKQGGNLYLNHYEDRDHSLLMKRISKIKLPWMLTYDDTPLVRRLYKDFQISRLSLRYSAARVRRECELFIHRSSLQVGDLSSALGDEGSCNREAVFA